MSKNEHSNSIEAETSVIGAILLEGGGRAWDLATEFGIDETFFTSSKTSCIFSAMKDMSAKGYPIDPVTLTDRLRSNGKLEEAGGAQFISHAIEHTPTSAHAEYYMAILIDRKMKRDLISKCNECVEAATSGDMSGEMIRQTYESELAKMTLSTGTPRNSISTLSDRAFTDWRDNALGKASLGVQTGIKWLDDATAGVMNQAYWVISGRPASCKSTLCRQIAENIAKQGSCVAIKTTEKTAEQYVGDMIAAEAQLSVHKLNCHGFPVSKLHYLESAKKIVAQLPVMIDGEMVTRTQLASWYKSSVQKGSRVNILDYIQDTLPCTKLEASNPEQKMTLATQEIRRLSKITGVPAIVVSTESNDGNLRYSGQTEFDATVWIRMSKAEDFDASINPHYIAEIKKSRFSPSGTQIDLFYFYGRLLTESDYQAKMAMLASRP